MNKYSVIYPFTLALFLALIGTSGCESTPASFLSTAAAIQVDVEVYKGPLARTRSAQLGELLGIAQNAERSFQEFIDTIPAQTSSCLPVSVIYTKSSAAERAAWDTEQNKHSLCEIANDAALIESRAKDIVDPIREFSNLIRVQDNVLTIQKTVEDLPSGQASVKSDLTPFLAGVQRDLYSPNISAETLESSSQKARTNATSVGANNFELTRQLNALASSLDQQATAVHKRSNTSGGTLDTCGTQIGANSNQKECLIEQIETFAEYLEGRAAYWSNARLVSLPNGNAGLDTRRYLVQFVTLASDFGNEIATRADLYLKESTLGADGTDKMATSDYLRDAAPTEYLNLFDWYEAAQRQHEPELNRRDRVRTARTLFADRYWTKVNEVFASGQGNVKMALIKDDIGNWNLKSFDSDPQDLLNAYKDMTLAGVKLATQVATGQADKNLLSVAGSLSRGTIGGSTAIAQSDSGITSVRTDTVASLRATQKRLGDQQSELDLQVAKSADLLKSAKDTAITKQTALSNASTAVATVTSSLNAAKAATPPNNQSVENLERQLQAAQGTQQQASAENVEAASAVQKAQSDNDAARTHRQQEIERSLSEVRIQINAYRSALAAVEKIVQSSNQ